MTYITIGQRRNSLGIVHSGQAFHSPGTDQATASTIFASARPLATAEKAHGFCAAGFATSSRFLSPRHTTSFIERTRTEQVPA